MTKITLSIDPGMLDGGYIERLIQEFPNEIGKQFDPLRQVIPKNLVHNREELRPFGGLKQTDELTDRFEQLYGDRALFRVIDTCQARCDNCYIKYQIGVIRRLDSVSQERLIASPEEINQVLEEVRNQPQMRNFLVSGGTPLMLTSNSIDELVTAFLDIPHIKQLYIAGSRPIFNPKMFSPELARALAKHNKYKSALKENKRVAITVHINHPYELQPEVVEGLNNFSQEGIPIYSQTILMKGINDEPGILEELYSSFVQIGVTPYYLLHGMPIKFAESLRTNVQKGIDLMKHLETCSGHERPLYTVATKVGKVNLNGTSKLEYEFENGTRYVVLETSYKKGDFLRTTRRGKLPQTAFERNGFLYVKYLDGKS